MLHNLFFYLVVLPATGLFCSIAIVFKRHGTWSGRTWGRVVMWATRSRYEVDLSALEPGQDYVFMANHQSQLDIPVLNAILGMRQVAEGRPGLGFVAKQSLFDIPLFGPAIRAVGHIPIDRSNRRRAMKSIDQAVEDVKNGTSIVIFPEGTRAVDLSKLQEFKVGGFIIAIKTGRPVAPVVVTGTGDCLPKHKLRLRRAPVKVRALAPIEPGRYSLKEREQFKDDLHTLMNEAYMAQRKEAAHAA